MKTVHILLALGVAGIWGFAFVCSRLALDSFTPAQLTTLRFLIAALPVLFIRKPDISWPTLILLGMLIFTGQFMFLFFAYEAGMPPGLASVTTHSQAFFTILLAVFFFRERPGRRRIAGAAIAFAGLFAVAATAGVGDLTYMGLALTLAGAVSWAFGNILLKTLRDVDMLALMIWLSLVPPLPGYLLSLTLGEDPNLVNAVAGASWSSIGALLYLGLLSTAIAYSIWGRLLNTYPAVMVTPFALFAPCVGILSSYLLLGETFSPLRATGMIMIMGGVALSVWKKREPVGAV